MFSQDSFLDLQLWSRNGLEGVREWELALTLTLSPKERERLRTLRSNRSALPGIAALGVIR